MDIFYRLIKRIGSIGLIGLLIILILPANVNAEDEEIIKVDIKDVIIGTKVNIENTIGTVVDPNNRLILLDNTIYKSFDTKERNKFDNSNIKDWLNNEFKEGLVNNEWIKDGSISLLNEEEYELYKDYLSDCVSGWLKEPLTPTEEPVEGLFVDNQWNYVKVILNGNIAGIGYNSSFFVSAITLELGNNGYKLKNGLGKSRILVPNSAITVDTGEFGSLNVGDKIRFANKWWTLIDVENKKILGEFNYINKYLNEDEELIGEERIVNKYKFSNDTTPYENTEHSIKYYLENEFRNTFFYNYRIESIDIPTVLQYNTWKSEGINSGYIVYEEIEGKTRIYLIENNKVIPVGAGETHPVRVLIQLNNNVELIKFKDSVIYVIEDNV